MPLSLGCELRDPGANRESDNYQVGAMGEALEVKTRQYHFSVADVFQGNRFWLGLSMIVGESDRSFTPTGGGTLSRSAWGFGLGLGALYVLPYRVLLGLSYTTPIHYGMNWPGDVNPSIGGFFRMLSRLTGWGWGLAGSRTGFSRRRSGSMFSVRRIMSRF